jgi:hypothetical protein
MSTQVSPRALLPAAAEAFAPQVARAVIAYIRERPSALIEPGQLEGAVSLALQGLDGRPSVPGATGPARPTGREQPGEHWNARLLREQAGVPGRDAPASPDKPGRAEPVSPSRGVPDTVELAAASRAVAVHFTLVVDDGISEASLERIVAGVCDDFLARRWVRSASVVVTAWDAGRG